MKKDIDTSQSGGRVREERKRLGLSQAEAAQLCGVVRETWGKYERGVFELGGAALRAFVEAGADADYIVTGFRSQVFEAMAEQSMPAHMQPGDKGQEAALLCHWRSLPPALRARVSDLAEVLANLHARAAK